MKQFLMTRLSDVIWLMFIVMFTFSFSRHRINFEAHPFEDAAMLMRYSEHLAQGYGIVWNIGETPVEGATDFLFMIVVAFLNKIGLTIETAVRSITILSHYLTIILIYCGMRLLQKADRFSSGLSATYFAVGPGLALSAAYFGTPFFALGICCSWLLAQRLILREKNISTIIVFSLICLLTGLTRPEGVIISCFMVLAIGVLVPARSFFKTCFIFGTIFAILGGAYFLWRWNYFGYVLPNPMYKKAGGHFYLTSLIGSVKNSMRLIWPIFPAFALALRSRSSMRQVVAFSIPIVGSVIMWCLLSSEMNFGYRFQYPVFVIGIMSWFPLVKTLSADLRLFKWGELDCLQKMAITTLIIGGSWYVVFVRMKDTGSITYSQRDGRYTIACVLSQYKNNNYLLATTEAGLLPFYSKWKAIDTWGLNDQWIAHHGPITSSYLEKRMPDVLMFHAFFSPSTEHSPNVQLPIYLRGVDKQWIRRWNSQILTIKNFAEQHKYLLAAAFCFSSSDAHYYYVRRDNPDCMAIVQRIRDVDYRSEAGEVGKKFVN